VEVALGRRRAVTGALVTLAGALVGAVLLSGSDQPVTAHPYPRWQELAAPPFSARTHALAVQAGHLVVVLGGRRADGSTLRDGAAYDLRTGRWRHLVAPVGLTSRDRAVAAAGTLVVAAPSSWWRYDVATTTWSRLHDVPQDARAPSAFGSEVYALSGYRVVVYSVQLGRWTPLPADRLRPTLRARSVAASRRGTFVTGRAGTRRVTDRWDGLRWRRVGAGPPPRVPSPPDGSARLEVGGRTFVVRNGRAWIRLP
jgi:hypothetical protein